MKAEDEQGLSGERSSPRERRSCELPNANHTWGNRRRSDVAFKVRATWALENQQLQIWFIKSIGVASMSIEALLELLGSLSSSEVFR